MDYLIKDNKTEYHICYDANASSTIRFAAIQLQKYLYYSTNTLIPMFSTYCNSRGKEIHLGNNVRNNDYSYLLNDLKEEDFIIKKVNDNYVIDSLSDRGILYGVYYFLRLAINFVSLDKDTIHYNKVTHVKLIDNIVYHHIFNYRECYSTDAFDATYASTSMLNSNLSDIPTSMGGHVKWYNFHHSFKDLINPNEYFDTHPEYFSEIDGVRVKEHTELCLSNNDVYNISLKKLRNWIENNKECKVFSVAQDEWMGHFTRMACECKECKAFDELHGSQSASIIRFVNRLATDITKDYPDIYIHTLAYQYSRKAPINMEIHKNVIVRLCNIECSWGESIEDGAKHNNERNKAFLKDLKDWSKLTNNLYIWDYMVNYRNYLAFFPNIRTMASNIETYKKYNVKGILMEGNFSNGTTPGYDILKNYIFKELIKTNNITNIQEYLNKLLSDFSTLYYKECSNEVIQLVNLFEDCVKGHDLWLYDDCDAPYFTDELLDKANELVKVMESKLNRLDTILCNRISLLRLSIDYMIICRLPLNTPNRNQLIDDFGKRIKEAHITELFERTNLDYSLEVMKKSRYAKERENWYSLYYVMR